MLKINGAFFNVKVFTENTSSLFPPNLVVGVVAGTRAMYRGNGQCPVGGEVLCCTILNCLLFLRDFKVCCPKQITYNSIKSYTTKDVSGSY